jgi:hypothetical protein
MQEPDAPTAVKQLPITTGGRDDLMHKAWPAKGDPI